MTVIRYSCPLRSCGWSFTDPPEADEFVPLTHRIVITRVQTPHRDMQTLEATIVEHLGTHKVHEWAYALAEARAETAKVPDDIGERLAAALERRNTEEPHVFDCNCCGTLPGIAHWLRENTTAILAAPPGAAHYVEVVECRVIGEWGTTAAADVATAREQVERARAFAPPIAARAESRIVRTWPDGGRYTGPWQALTDEEPQPCP